MGNLSRLIESSIHRNKPIPHKFIDTLLARKLQWTRDRVRRTFVLGIREAPCGTGGSPRPTTAPLRRHRRKYMID